MEINIQPNESVTVVCFMGKSEERIIIQANAIGIMTATKQSKSLGGMVLGQ